MTNFEIIKRLFKTYTKNYLNKILLSIFFSLLVAGSTSSIAWLLDPAIEKIFIEKNQTLILIIPALIILLREIAVSGLREYLAGIKVSVPVSKISKLKTALQLIALGILILSESGISFIPILFIGKIALWSAAILTLYTGYDYLKSGFKHF